MKLTLVQKVLISVIFLFIVTSSVLSIAVASQIKQAYLGEQKRNVAEFVQKQALQHLNSTLFNTNDYESIFSKFLEFQNEIITKEIVRIKIYNTKGVVLYSDQKDLIGQNLFAEEPEELKEILLGNVIAGISKPDKKENIYEKQYNQLLEIYTPIFFEDTGVAGVIEVYYNLDLLSSEILQSQTYLIISIGLIFTILFILLFILVKNASRKIIEQDKQLQIDIKKEQEYSSLKDEFIRLSSHQLRTPASAIKWTVEVLNDNDTGQLNADQKKLLETITESTNTLVSIVDNFLVVADIKPDYFTLEKSAYPLSDLIAEILKNKTDKFNHKNLNVTFNLSHGLNKINLKKEALTRVINILIDNAIDYSRKNGNILIELSQINNKQQFLIKDNGIGIPMNEQTKIFDKLFRASNSIEQKNSGSGLSLFIAKQIIEGYSGKIWFVSNKNGSAFTFEIPCG